MRNSFALDTNKPEDLKSQLFINILNKTEDVEYNLAQENIPASQANLHRPRRSIISNNKIIKSGNNLGAGRSQFGPSNPKKKTKYA